MHQVSRVRNNRFAGTFALLPSEPAMPLSLNHQFGLVRVPGARSELLKQEMCKVVTLHDDFLFYISDTLNWIPTYNPSRRKRQNGLNLCGVTVLDHRGAREAEMVFLGWAELISRGPDQIRLRGPYGKDANGIERYSRLVFPRTSIVSSLRRLAANCSKVAASPRRNIVLLHKGI